MPQAPVGVPESFEDHAQLLFDLLALAYETDQTRVFTFMLCREFSVRTYPNIGVTEPHHTVSHTQERARADRRAHEASTPTTCSCSPGSCERLRATPDGDGSLLDHSTILYGSGMGDGNVHAPVAAADGGRRWHRACRAGGTSSLPEKTPLPNLLLGAGRRFGVELPASATARGSSRYEAAGVTRTALVLAAGR